MGAVSCLLTISAPAITLGTLTSCFDVHHGHSSCFHVASDFIIIGFHHLSHLSSDCSLSLEPLGGLAGINCHCQWGLTGLLGGIVIMLAAGRVSQQLSPSSPLSESQSKSDSATKTHIISCWYHVHSHFCSIFIPTFSSTIRLSIREAFTHF